MLSTPSHPHDSNPSNSDLGYNPCNPSHLQVQDQVILFSSDHQLPTHTYHQEILSTTSTSHLQDSNHYHKYQYNHSLTPQGNHSSPEVECIAQYQFNKQSSSFMKQIHNTAKVPQNINKKDQPVPTRPYHRRP